MMFRLYQENSRSISENLPLAVFRCHMLLHLLDLRWNGDSKTPDPGRASAAGTPTAFLQEAKKRF